jgi:hypothetical protein
VLILQRTIAQGWRSSAPVLEREAAALEDARVVVPSAGDLIRGGEHAVAFDAFADAFARAEAIRTRR